jgi:hypothetical protein
MYNINKMANKRINKKIRKEALEQLNKLKQNSQVANRSYEAIKKTIEESRIDVVKRLQLNFNVLVKSKSTEKITKGSLKEVVETIKETKRNVMAKFVPSIKKKYNDIGLVKDFNKNRKEITIRNMTGVKLQRILKNLDTRKGVLLKAGDIKYILKPQTIQELINNVDKFYVNETSVDGSDKLIIQEIMDLKHITLIPFDKKKDKNQGGFFKYYNLTAIDLTDFQIYDYKQDVYTENCFVYALKESTLLTDEEINSIRFMCCGMYVPCNKITEVCDKFNLTIRVKIISTNHIVKKYGKGERIINIGLIDKHYFAIKEIPYTLYSIKHYEDLKEKEKWNEFYKPDRKSKDRYTDSFQAIKYMFENKEKYFQDMPYEDMLDTQYANEVGEITDLTYLDSDIQPNKVYEKKINGNLISTYNYGKQVELKFELVYFDFETITEGENHSAYLVCNSETQTKYGTECGKLMLYDLCNKFGATTEVLILVAHNAGYDYRFIMKHLILDSETTSGKRLLQSTGKFCYGKGKFMKIIIKDSLSISSMSLDKWGKAMKVPSEKQIMPYDLYTAKNVNSIFIDKAICKSACIDEYKKKKYCEGIEATEEEATKFYDKFLENAIKWDCIKDDKINIIAYSKYYCDMDINVLKECYTKMRAICLETFDIDILDCMSSSQLAQRFMEINGVFEDVYMLSSTPREYIMKCIEGGRVMCADNVKHSIALKVADFDAVSLYPSAMDRLEGYLKGKPKVLQKLPLEKGAPNTACGADPTYESLKNYDGYFVQIIVKTIKTPRSFSLMSDKNEDGIRVFDNELPKKMYVCKQKLEDLIEFQGITFDIIDGYYYDEGRNYKLRDVIRFAFNERIKLKAEGNPLQEVYKLIMNGAYGKTLQSAYDEKIIFIYGEQKLQDYVSKNYNYIDNYIEFSDPNDEYKKYRVKLIKPINSVFNNVPCGVEVLGMSKRIMNEVMCLAEDNEMKIYYQDTDSMHIEDRHIEPLSKLYEEKYGRTLIGKNMGQFHSDFSSDKIKENIIAVKSLFLGKKCYIDVLEGEDENGNVVQDYHMRMKGVNDIAIKYYCLTNNINPYELYKKLYEGSKIKLDLTAGGNKCSFEFNKNYTITSNSAFIREICF